MNCVNCGAPARGPSCIYCNTPADVAVYEADRVGFATLQKMLDGIPFDSDMVEAVQVYAGVGGKLTAGQVRAILARFRFDSDRLDAGALLIPLTINRTQLLEIGDVFVFGSDRSEFFATVAAGGGPRPKPPGTTARPSGSGGFTAFVVVLWAVFALWWLLGEE